MTTSTRLRALVLFLTCCPSLHAAVSTEFVPPPDGVLRVTSDAADAIRVTCLFLDGLGDGVFVNAQALIPLVPCEQVNAVVIQGGPGANAIDLGAMTPADFTLLSQTEIRAGGGDDVIIGSFAIDQIAGDAGADQIDARDGDDALRWTDGDGSDSFDGEAGVDALFVTTAATDDDLLIEPVAATTALVRRANQSPFAVSFTRIETLQVDSGDGADQVSTQGLAGVEQALEGGAPSTFPGDVLTVVGFDGDLAATPVVNLPGASAIAHVGFEFGTFGGRLGGAVFEDLDGDGLREAADRPLVGVEIFADANGNAAPDPEEVRTRSAADGTYLFTFVVDVSITPRLLDPPADGILTTNQPPSQVLTAGAVIDDVDFGVFIAPSATGLVFADADRNGVRDAGDAGLAGIIVFDDRDANGQPSEGEARGLSDADGRFRLDALPPGVIRARVQLPALRTLTTALPEDAVAISSSLLGGIEFGIGSLPGAQLPTARRIPSLSVAGQLGLMLLIGFVALRLMRRG